MLLNYITWDVSPFIYEGEHFAIGWYGTLWVLGLIGLLATLLLTFKHDKVPIQYAYITFMVTLVCVIFFGHLFQGLFYEWYYAPSNPVHFLGTDWYYRNYYFEHPWKFLDFAHGGFASHGTVLGVIIAGVFLSKIVPLPVWWMIDRIMMGLCLIGISVRFGNFVNAEICGITTNLPWGVSYDCENILHPTQIYEAISYLVALCFSFCLYICKKSGYQGLITSVIVAIVMISRIVIEFVKQPQMHIEAEWSLYMGQWLSIPFAIWAIWLMFYTLENSK
jgi:prolipoprotein diacylglyceryltransferase